MNIVAKISRLLLSQVVICAFCAAFSQAGSPLAENIQKKYGQLKSFEASFEQTLTHKESGSVEKRNGRLYFQKPLLARWQTDKPHEETLVINSREIWDYLPDEEIAYRYSPELVNDSRSIIQVITGQAALTKDFDVKDAGKDNGMMKLILYPREPAPQMVEAAIWVDPEDSYIKRAQITDFYGNANDVRFTAFKADASIPASQFKFAPPKGIDVEDRIDSKIQERELFK